MDTSYWYGINLMDGRLTRHVRSVNLNGTEHYHNGNEEFTVTTNKNKSSIAISSSSLVLF